MGLDNADLNSVKYVQSTMFILSYLLQATQSSFLHHNIPSCGIGCKYSKIYINFKLTVTGGRVVSSLISRQDLHRQEGKIPQAIHVAFSQNEIYRQEIDMSLPTTCNLKEHLQRQGGL